MHNQNLLCSICSFILGCIGYLVQAATDYHIMGMLGFVCLCFSIYAGYLTIKEKKMSIREMKASGVEEIKAIHMLKRILKRKSGGKV